MLWIFLVFGILGTLITFFFTLIRLCDFHEFIKIMFIWFVIIGSVLTEFLQLFILNYDEVVQTSDWELLSFSNNNNVYSLYYKTDDALFETKTVSSDIVNVIEDDNCTPHVIEYTIYEKNILSKFIQIILTFKYRNSSHKKYTIYIPTQETLETFNMNHNQFLWSSLKKESSLLTTIINSKETGHHNDVLHTGFLIITLLPNASFLRRFMHW